MRNQEYTSIDQTCEHCPVRYRGRVMRLTYFSFHGPVSIISLAQHTPTNQQNSLHDFTSEIFRVTPEVLQQTCCGDTETVPATLYSHPGSEDLVVESRKCKCFRPHLAKLRRTGNDDGPCQCSHQGYECIIIYMCIYLHVAGLYLRCRKIYISLPLISDFSLPVSPRRWYGHGKLFGGSMSQATSAHSGSGEEFPVSQVRLHGSHQGRTVTNKKRPKKNGGFWPTYCWWTKSCTTKDDDYPIIYRVLTIPGGAGFRPSTVFHQPRVFFPEIRRFHLYFFFTTIWVFKLVWGRELIWPGGWKLMTHHSFRKRVQKKGWWLHIATSNNIIWTY